MHRVMPLPVLEAVDCPQRLSVRSPSVTALRRNTFIPLDEITPPAFDPDPSSAGVFVSTWYRWVRRAPATGQGSSPSVTTLRRMAFIPPKDTLSPAELDQIVRDASPARMPSMFSSPMRSPTRRAPSVRPFQSLPSVSLSVAALRRNAVIPPEEITPRKLPCPGGILMSTSHVKIATPRPRPCGDVSRRRGRDVAVPNG